MKLLPFAALLLILSVAGCGSEDEDSIIPGYLSPGDFRPKGMLVKEYTLTDPTFTGGDGSCSGEECLAVYALWVTSNIPVEGLAVKDDDTVDSRLLLKISRIKYGAWVIRLTYKGIEYGASAGSADLLLELCNTTTPTFPAYTYDPDLIPGNEDDVVYDVSASTLSRATLTVIAPIALLTDDGTKTIILNPGDEIIAQAFNALTTATCP